MQLFAHIADIWIPWKWLCFVAEKTNMVKEVPYEERFMFLHEPVNNIVECTESFNSNVFMCKNLKIF